MYTTVTRSDTSIIETFTLYMISLFFFLCIDWDKICFTVWSTEASIEQNLIPLSESWFRIVPEVNIIFPTLSENSRSILKDQLKGNAAIHVFNETSEEHTKFLSYKYIFNLNPNKEIYYFGNDFTFVLPRYICDIVYPYNVARSLIFSTIIPLEDSLKSLFITDITKIGFPSSISGHLITRSLLKSISEQLHTYSFDYELPHDLNLAIFIDNKVCSLDLVLTNLPGVMNPRKPTEEYVTMPSYGDYPIGLPHATYTSEDTSFLEKFINAAYFYKDNEVIDWSLYTLQHLVLPDEESKKSLHFAFGFTFYRDNLNSDSCFAESQILPINDGSNITKYSQHFSCNYNVIYECDDILSDVQLVSVKNKDYTLKLKCPKTEKIIDGEMFQVIDVNVTELMKDT